MATVAIQKSLFPLNKVIGDFIQQIDSQVEANLQTQHIWPTEVYPGYKEKNEYNKRKGYPHSTGRGARSFRSRLVNVSSANNLTVQFSFNQYMQFAELGAGGHIRAEDVDRSKKARYKSRYIQIWDREEGRSHRPAIMMEIRHFQRRVENYLADFYGISEPMFFIKTLENMNLNIKL